MFFGIEAKLFYFFNHLVHRLLDRSYTFLLILLH